MAAPTHRDTQSNNGFGASASVTKPTGTAEDDILIMAVDRGGRNTTITWPTGFTELSQTAYPTGSDGALSYAEKRAGTSEPSSYSASWTNSTGWKATVTAVDGAKETGSAVIANPTDATGSSTSPNPPASGTFASSDVLVLVIVGQEGGSTGGRFTPPTNYTERADKDSGGTGSNANAITVATRELTSVTSEDPGTLTSTVNDDWCAATVVIEAVSGGGTTLSGASFTINPTFYAGQVDLEVVGAAFSISPTFFAGQVDLEIVGAAFTVSPTFFAGTVELRIDGAPFVVSPTFYAGSVATNYDLDGAAFNVAPTFFAGSVDATYDLDGAAFNVAPTFFAGTIDATYDLTGAAFSVAPTFYAGAVSHQIGGVAFSVAPTFFAGTVTSAGTIDGAAFSVSPTFYVGTITPDQAVDGAAFVVAPTFFAGTVEQNIAGVLFTATPLFFAGAVDATYDLDGAAFSVAPNFFAGTVSAGTVLDGAAFSVSPTFFAGTVSATYDIDGAAFTVAPTFYVGEVRVQISGALLTVAPTFYAGTVTQAQVLNGAAFTVAPTFYAGALRQPLIGAAFSVSPTFFVGNLVGPLNGQAFSVAPIFHTGVLIEPIVGIDVAKYRLTANFVISDGNPTAVEWDEMEFGSGFELDGTNPTRVYNRSGSTKRYLVSGTVQSGTKYDLKRRIITNGTTYWNDPPEAEYLGSYAGYAFSLSPVVVEMADDDYLELEVTDQGGVTLLADTTLTIVELLGATGTMRVDSTYTTATNNTTYKVNFGTAEVASPAGFVDVTNDYFVAQRNGVHLFSIFFEGGPYSIFGDLNYLDLRPYVNGAAIDEWFYDDNKDHQDDTRLFNGRTLLLDLKKDDTVDLRIRNNDRFQVRAGTRMYATYLPVHISAFLTMSANQSSAASLVLKRIDFDQADIDYGGLADTANYGVSPPSSGVYAVLPWFAWDTQPGSQYGYLLDIDGTDQPYVNRERSIGAGSEANTGPHVGGFLDLFQLDGGEVITAEALMQHSSTREFYAGDTGVLLLAFKVSDPIVSGKPFTVTPTFFEGTIAVGTILGGALFLHSGPTFFAGQLNLEIDGAAFSVAPTFFAGTVALDQVVDGAAFTVSPTFFVGTIDATYDLDGAAFTVSPTFYVGSVDATYDLDGAAFTVAPSFFVGTVEFRLDGAAFTVGPTFFAGMVVGGNLLGGQPFSVAPTFYAGLIAPDQVVDGAAFSVAPSFFAGTINAATTLEGAAFSVAPTFYAGTVTSNYDLAGALLSVGPTFFAGTVTPTYTIDGAAFSVAPSFFAGTVSQDQQVDGAAFSIAPVFYGGSIKAAVLEGQPFTIAPVFGEVVDCDFPRLLDGRPDASKQDIWSDVSVAGDLGWSFRRCQTGNNGTITPSNTIQGAAFTVSPTFFAGKVSTQLLGAAFSVAPTFFVGNIASDALLGTPFVVTPVFNTGTIIFAQQLDGSAFVITPVFNGGALVTYYPIDGTPFSVAPVFYAGDIATLFLVVATLTTTFVVTPVDTLEKPISGVTGLGTSGRNRIYRVGATIINARN